MNGISQISSRPGSHGLISRNGRFRQNGLCTIFLFCSFNAYLLYFKCNFPGRYTSENIGRSIRKFLHITHTRPEYLPVFGNKHGFHILLLQFHDGSRTVKHGIRINILLLPQLCCYFLQRSDLQIKSVLQKQCKSGNAHGHFNFYQVLLFCICPLPALLFLLLTPFISC